VTAAARPLFLLSLALLPWAWLPPFPWLHPRAQWSDLVFAVAATLWAGGLVAAGRRPRVGGLEAALSIYLAAAAVSWAVRGEEGSVFKLLGLAELGALLVVTAHLAGGEEGRQGVGWAVGLTSLAVAGAAAAGVAWFWAGRETRLVGTYGDLVPGAYARAQAGLLHPNALASFCVFASTAVAWGLADHRPRLARLIQAALAATVALTFSRSILTFGLAALLPAALRRGRRGAAVAGVLLVATTLGFFTVYDVRLDPTRPWTLSWTGASSPRAQAFTSAARTVAAHPWLGAGLGRAPALVDGAPFEAHCTPLDVAATLGLPALAAFVAMVVFLWKRLAPRDPVLWSGLLALGLDGLTEDVADFRHLWVLFGLAASPRSATAP
jgi:hypothetical protein